uniref:AAA family ATPase n=1 Tax=Arenibaculum pallidiluteum TaxID=2812559 RepID=UPI001A961AFF
MESIALLSQKGGCAKTSLALNIATAAVAAGRRVAIVDCDKQGSSKRWQEDREGRPMPLLAHVGSDTITQKLPELVQRANASDIDLMIFDTPPTAEDCSAALSGLVDLILVPSQPRTLDVRAIRRTLELVQPAIADGRVHILLIVLLMPFYRNAFDLQADLEGLRIAAEE